MRIEEVTAETKRKNTKVRLKGIKFRADQALKNEVGAVKLKNIKHDGHSSKLSDVEIDMRLRAYFADHQLMTRADFQQICGFMRSKAMDAGADSWCEGQWETSPAQPEELPTQPVGTVVEQIAPSRAKPGFERFDFGRAE